MFPCAFCQNDKALSYIYTVCDHFVCKNCAAIKIDPNLQLLICCGKTTYLDDKALQELVNQNKNIHQKINKKEDRQSIQLKVDRIIQQTTSQKQKKQFQKVLELQIEKVKRHFEEQYRVLKERQNQAINKLINNYQDEIKRHRTQQIIRNMKPNFKDKSEQSSFKEYYKFKQERKQNYHDGIIKKLQINQQRMDAKLQKLMNQ